MIHVSMFGQFASFFIYNFLWLSNLICKGTGFVLNWFYFHGVVNLLESWYESVVTCELGEKKFDTFEKFAAYKKCLALRHRWRLACTEPSQ